VCDEESAVAARGLSRTAMVDSSGHGHDEALGVTVLSPAAGLGRWSTRNGYGTTVDTTALGFQPSRLACDHTGVPGESGTGATYRRQRPSSSSR
jgi:hypothetical protein